MTDNPLLAAEFNTQLPPFELIKAEHFFPAIEQCCASTQNAIDALLERAEELPMNWESVYYPIEHALDQLDRLWSVVTHLNAVVNTDAIREAHAQCLPVITAFHTRLGQNQQFYELVKKYEQSDAFSSDSGSRKKCIQNSLRDFRLSGIGLDESAKAEYAQRVEKLSELATQFANNVLDATNAYSLHIEGKAELPGVPDLALQAASELAQSKDKSGYVFTLDIPSYLPMMQYCDNRQLREQLYQAYVTRASEVGPNGTQFDNTTNMAEILEQRKALADLLGFDNFAEKSLATKMAASAGEVVQFLEQLASHSVDSARQEYRELKAFAKETLNLSDVQAWDIAYVSEKLRQHRYELSQEELKPFFPVDRVIDGMFSVVNRLYGITVKQDTPPSVWHDDVRFYSVFDANGKIKAQFYLDLFARQGKRGGAWMADCQCRHQRPDGSLQLPVAFLVCNFTPPTSDTPSLLTHNEVTTLFHEFGHGLHHMLTEINDTAVAGINGVAWDAVELPSQFLENWCWEPDALPLISSHYETGEPLPQALLDRMLAAKNFQSAMQMVRQLEFALFDFLIHRDFGSDTWQGIDQTMMAVRQQVAAYEVPAFNRFAHSFSHIFAGGYAAGYYSYKWAEVLSADAYSLFEERGIFDRETGQQFVDTILSKGGSEEPAVLFKRFRGRKPSVDALLRHSGIDRKSA